MAFIHNDISWSRQYWTLRTCHLSSALTPIRAWFSRVKFYTQEIVFFRQDLLYRMRRSCLIPPTAEETSDPFEHASWITLFIISVRIYAVYCSEINQSFFFQLVATITHQSHLCPLPLTVQPIIWNYDHCLRLYPTPDMVLPFSTQPVRTLKCFLTVASMNMLLC